MKNAIILFNLIIFLLFSDQISAQNKSSFTIQGGYNIINKVEGNKDTQFLTKTGLPSFYMEYHRYFFSNNKSLKSLGIGLGAGSYNTKVDDDRIAWLWTYPSDEVGSLFWWPLYLSIKYNVASRENKLIPYFKMDHGYSFFYASNNIKFPDDRDFTWSTRGGYYMGLSTGVTINKIIEVELNYSFLSSIIKTRYKYYGSWYRWDEDYKARMLTLSLGLCF